MEAFLARAARGRPAALVWETIHACGDVSACQTSPGLSGAPKKSPSRMTEKMEPVHGAALCPTGLELD